MMNTAYIRFVVVKKAICLTKNFKKSKLIMHWIILHKICLTNLHFIDTKDRSVMELKFNKLRSKLQIMFFRCVWF